MKFIFWTEESDASVEINDELCCVLPEDCSELDLHLARLFTLHDNALKNLNFSIDMAEEDKVILLSKVNEVLGIKPLIKRKI